jgi:hypothetical protein
VNRPWDPARAALTLFLAVYGWFLAIHPGYFGFIDNVDLAIHETGHLVFSPFGEFLTVLGGTLFQLIVPLIFVGYFALRRDWYSATVPLWWVAQNCWNIARYVSDARAQDLPLVGGGEHDWFWILGELDLLHRDLAIGRAVQGIGVLIYLVSVIAGAFLARKAPGTLEDSAATG